MPRRARLTLPNVPLHLIQRGSNRQACFVADEGYRCCLDWLTEHADKTGCRIHATSLKSRLGPRGPAGLGGFHSGLLKWSGHFRTRCNYIDQKQGPVGSKPLGHAASGA